MRTEERGGSEHAHAAERIKAGPGTARGCAPQQARGRTFSSREGGAEAREAASVRRAHDRRMSRLAALVSTMVLAESASPGAFQRTANAETPNFAGHCVASRRIHTWCARRTSGMVRVVCLAPQRSVEGFASDINKAPATWPRETACRRLGRGKNKGCGRSGGNGKHSLPRFG